MIRETGTSRTSGDPVTALVERHGLTPAARAARFSAMVVVASPFVRETIVRSLRALGAVDVVEAASVAEARVRARSDSPRDLCVVDSALPDGSGMALVGELRAIGWSRGVLLSSSEDLYTVRAALATGVRAFLVSSAAAPSGVASPSAAGTTVPVQRPRTPGRATGAEGLSAREVEVLQLVGDGRSNKEIGEALGLSALTVKSHLARIARKIGTGDRAEMVVVAMRAGVVT
jgi:DNA-binding NarL/FixJ family response regulator